MYEIGEEVYIRAFVTDIIADHGEIKYKIKAEHSNNDLDHNFTEHQLFILPKSEEESEDDDHGFKRIEQTLQ